MTKNIFTFLLILIGCLSGSAETKLEKINDFSSPEHLYITKDKSTIYIGLSTFPAIAVFDVGSKKVTEFISMPAPVSGIVVDENHNILYTGSKDSKDEVFVYNLEKGKSEKSIQTGYGPEDLIIAAKSQLLFVTNRFNNNVSVIDLETRKEISRIDVVREPVALAISPNEELLAVANLLPDQSAMSNFISSNISLIDIQSKTVVKNIDLPNGSFAIQDVIYSNDGKYLYASHLIGRFNVLTSQIEKGWINTNALSIIDVETQQLNTTVLLDDIYKGAANPAGMEISEDGKRLLLAISGTHELFVIDREAMHLKLENAKKYSQYSQAAKQISSSKENVKVFQEFSEIEQMEVLFEDIPRELGFLSSVRQRIRLKGNGPQQVVSVDNMAYVSSYFSDGIEVVDFSKNAPQSELIKLSEKEYTSSKVRFGEMLFHDAENCFQQWQSCASCHPGDGRVDGLNWDLMNDGIGNPKNTKSLLLSHQTPPAMATGIRKDAETGVRAGFKYIQFFDAPEEHAKAVDEYLKSLKPVPSPYLVNGKLSGSAKKGKKIFENRNCGACHSGSYFTNMEKYEMGEIGKYDKQNFWDTPTLIELWRTAPYMHNGKYNKMEDIFSIEKHGIQDEITDSEIEDLSEYLLSL